jgi:hypothetical protein
MKYTLIAEDDFGGSTTTREFTADCLPDVLTEIELFLRGAGFFFNGNLDFVDDFAETPEWNIPEWDTPQEDPELHEWTAVRRADAMAEGHSQYYYETGRNR